MIVEIQGIDTERMERIKEGLINMGFSRVMVPEREIRINANTGKAVFHTSHKAIFGWKNTHIRLREPEEHCITIDVNSEKDIFLILDILGLPATNSLHNLFKKIEEEAAFFCC